MNDFVGSEYYSNSLLLGSGVALVPFYSVLSGDFGNVDIPYTGDYTYWYLNSDSALYFTPKENFYDDNVDTNLYMRPVILDQTLSSEELLNLFQFTEIKLGVYQDYQSSSKLTYSYYWNNSYNDFFIIDSSKLTSTSGMYQLVYSNANTFTNISLNQMIVYFDPRAWNVAHFNIRTNQQSVAVNGVNGTTWLYRGDVINSRSDLLQDNNIQNRPQYGNTSGDTGTGGISGLGGFGDFLNSLLGGISGIGEFISSVSGGISTLFESISSIVTLAFSVLNSLPLPVSSLLYLTFLLTIVAIILKIFLQKVW